MLWYPPELSSLNSRARRSAAVHSTATYPTGDAANENLPYRPKVVSGSELLATQGTTRPVKIETGCAAFDDLLQGCIRPGLISLTGQDDAIVTMLSLYISVGYIVPCQGHVSIIDTAGSFDVVAMLGVVGYRFGKAMEVNKDVSSQEIAILDRMHISRVFDVHGLEQIVCELENQLLDMQSDDSSAPNIIIIGNTTHTFSAEITRNKLHGHACVEKFGCRLRRMAIQYQVVFLLLNTVAKPGAPGESTLPLSLSRSFADLLDVSMMISGSEQTRSPNGGKPEPIYSFAVLEDQSTLDGKIEARFRIRDGNQLEFLP